MPKTTQNAPIEKHHGQPVSHGSDGHAHPVHAHYFKNHSAVNLRTKTGHLVTARAGDYITRDDDGNVLSVSSTKPGTAAAETTPPAPETVDTASN